MSITTSSTVSTRTSSEVMVRRRPGLWAFWFLTSSVTLAASVVFMINTYVRHGESVWWPALPVDASVVMVIIAFAKLIGAVGTRQSAKAIGVALLAYIGAFIAWCKFLNGTFTYITPTSSIAYVAITMACVIVMFAAFIFAYLTSGAYDKVVAADGHA